MENISSKSVKKTKHPVKIMQFGEGNFLRIARADLECKPLLKKDCSSGKIKSKQPVN